MTRITKFPVLALPSLLLLGLVQAQKSSRFSDSISSEDPTLEKIIGSWRAPSKNNKNPYWFPNDLTRDILPIGIHSHNDFWRDVPLYTALSHGAISVEADVFYFEDKDEEGKADLYVGHDRAALEKGRTLSSLYVDPLVNILERMNPVTEFMGEDAALFPHGVFSTSTFQTLYLFVDFKTALQTTSGTTLKTLHKAIAPLQEKNYLSIAKDGDDVSITSRPVTIILTGASGADQAPPIPKSGRPYFFDAPLNELTSNSTDPEKKWVVASGDFVAAIGGTAVTTPYLTNAQRKKLKKQITVAHGHGLLVRYWNTPRWPRHVRLGIWKELVALGVDLLNVDEMEDAVTF